MAGSAQAHLCCYIDSRLLARNEPTDTLDQNLAEVRDRFSRHARLAPRGLIADVLVAAMRPPLQVVPPLMVSAAAVTSPQLIEARTPLLTPRSAVAEILKAEPRLHIAL